MLVCARVCVCVCGRKGSGVKVVRESANYKRELILVSLIAIGCCVRVCWREGRGVVTW